MLPSGQPTSIGGVQSSLLRSNSGILGAQGGSISSPTAYPSILSPHNNQYNGISLLGNMPNGTSLLSQSYGNGVLNHGILGAENSRLGGMDEASESDTLSSVGNGLGFTSASSPFMVNPGSSVHREEQFPSPSGNPLIPDQQQSQQPENQKFQLNQHHNIRQQQHPQFQLNRAGLGGVGAVKVEPQATNDQNGQQHQLQSFRNIGQVKWEQQNLQNIRSLAPIKVEPQHSDQSLFLLQQQQQLLQLSRQSPQAAAAAQNNMLQQQRLFQQLQVLKAMPQQQSQLQHQFAPHNLPLRSPVKSVYEPGMCARRLTRYMHRQQQRPKDNNIEFWREFVVEFFAPHAKKKWCVSMYGSGRQTTGVFPQDVRHCEICNCKPGRGFEATVEVLPRLFKIKYDSGTVEELLYVDMPHEYPNASGQIVLDYAKAIQESVYDQLRVVRDGKLRIVFSPSPDLKICSWEFCAKSHEEVIPRSVLIPQVSQLGTAAQKYQTATQNASLLELQNNCNLFVSSARHLAKFMEVPLVNDLGYTKRYVRCLQISEVVNSMKDLIDYSRETGTGPMESLNKFPRRTNPTSGFNGEPQQSEEQQLQTIAHNSNNDQTSLQAIGTQLPSNNGVPSVNNSLNSATTSASPSTIVELLHQNSMNSRQPNPMSNANVPCTIPNKIQANNSPFQSPTPFASNNPPQVSHNPSNPSAHMSSTNSPANISIHQTAPSGEVDPSESQSSVHKIIQELMLSSSFGNDVKNVNGVLPSNNNSGFNGRMLMNGAVNINTGMVGNNSLASINGGRVGMAQMVRQQSMNQQQQGLGNQTPNGLNSFNDFQFDWKASP